MTAAAAGRRADTLALLADRVMALRRPGQVVRVGVDGVDVAGKTVLADELAALVRARGVEVLRASVDGFHHPREVRYRRGRSSPEGFWLDSYDLGALRRLLLEPLAPGGDRRVVVAIHDVDREVDLPQEVLDASAVEVLLLDGIFLHRDELAATWDLSVWLEVDVATSVTRLAARDGTDPDPTAPGTHRYVEGQRRYHAACDPAGRADLVVDNRDLPDAHVVVDRTRR